MKYCTKCVLPDTTDAIAFDQDGVCNVCRAGQKKCIDKIKTAGSSLV